MAQKTIAVMGATGQIGHVIVEKLLQDGHRVKAIGRDENKLVYLQSRGAEIVKVEGFDKTELLVQAFKGADGVFCMIPPGQNVEKYNDFQNKVGGAIKEGIQKNSIRYVVNLSSLGANLSDGTGPIKGLHSQEERLSALKDVNIVHLRPGYFMDNFFWSLPGVIQTGQMMAPLKADLSVPFIATVDIGLKAAEFLHNLNFQGHQFYELVGPRVLTMQEATKILGAAIGMPDLKYVQLSYDEVRNGMTASGMRGDMPELLVEMYQAMNNHLIQPTPELSGAHQGKTTIEQFSRLFAEAYQFYKHNQAPVS